MGPEDVATHYRCLFLGKTKEELHAILLNCRNQVIKTTLVSVGLVDRTQAHSREVFREAIRCCAVRVVLVHNHPSGDATPSQGDITISRELTEAGKVVGIEVTDHVIIGTSTPNDRDGFRSLRALGYL